MKVLDEESFDFDVSKKIQSSDIIKQNEDTCCSHSHCEDDSKIKQNKNKKPNVVADLNELEDLSQTKKHNKKHDSHAHKHSHSKHDHEHCESTENIEDDHNHSHSCDSHNHSHNHEHQNEHEHHELDEELSQSHEGIIYLILFKINICF